MSLFETRWMKLLQLELHEAVPHVRRRQILVNIMPWLCAFAPIMHLLSLILVICIILAETSIITLAQSIWSVFAFVVTIVSTASCLCLSQWFCFPLFDKPYRNRDGILTAPLVSCLGFLYVLAPLPTIWRQILLFCHLLSFVLTISVVCFLLKLLVRSSERFLFTTIFVHVHSLTSHDLRVVSSALDRQIPNDLITLCLKYVPLEECTDIETILHTDHHLLLQLTHQPADVWVKFPFDTPPQLSRHPLTERDYAKFAWMIKLFRMGTWFHGMSLRSPVYQMLQGPDCLTIEL